MGACHADCLGSALAQPGQKFENGAAFCYLVVEHDHIQALDLADDGANAYLIALEPLLGTGRYRRTDHSGECRSLLGVTEIGRHDNAICQMVCLVVASEFVQRMEMIRRNTEKPMHLRRVQRHRQYPAGAGSNKKIGNQARGDRDSRGILLIGTRVGMVWDYCRDPGSRSSSCGIQHQQKFNQVLLHRRHQGLNQKNVPFAAICLELHFEAVIGETLQP